MTSCLGELRPECTLNVFLTTKKQTVGQIR